MLQVLISDIATYNCYLLMLQLLFINVTTDRPKKKILIGHLDYRILSCVYNGMFISLA